MKFRLFVLFCWQPHTLCLLHDSIIHIMVGVCVQNVGADHYGWRIGSIKPRAVFHVCSLLEALIFSLASALERTV